ncbi:UDP-N-acetylglucosamine 4,6-dehydratase family protein, partial [Sphingomonas koreensis]|uniref:UDP-N-acetylglucosamine 4,6-dehydratase family protein n=1 Tax=Sphingomonas koreensis TaxID=93064 RepID=UPI00100207FC
FTLHFLMSAACVVRTRALPYDRRAARLSGGVRILVTGAGGTIGRELARQIAEHGPARLILLDANEFNLYDADLEMRESHPQVSCTPVLCSIRQRRQLMQVFAEHRPELVFHAAALKHVPLVEMHPAAGVQTNVLGTRNVADAARFYGALAMVQVSTDKAVNPVGFMGVTKRLGEFYCQALDLAGRGDPGAPRFITVRFGNVLGSSGSLIPLFQRQLSRGGPLTVTHPEIERFFMTVHEAVQLILQSASRGLRDGMRHGRIFVLDMGEPIRVIDIARRMIRLAGLDPEIDVGIDIIGLRPGEKLYEELFDAEESRLPSSIPGVFEAEPRPIPLRTLNKTFDALERASDEADDAACVAIATGLLDRRRASVADIAVVGARRPAIMAQAG